VSDDRFTKPDADWSHDRKWRRVAKIKAPLPAWFDEEVRRVGEDAVRARLDAWVKRE
jgi:hypothetical protein